MDMKAPPARRLERADLPVHTIALARFLIGKTLVHDLPEGRASGRIVEVEAYPRGSGGARVHRMDPIARVTVPGTRSCVRVLLLRLLEHAQRLRRARGGRGRGVLIRALEPLEGIESMARRRGTTRLLALTSGPGRLAVAMAINQDHDGLNLCGGEPLWLGAATRDHVIIDTSIRIGITRAVERRLRFLERGNPFVSGPKRLLRRS